MLCNSQTSLDFKKFNPTKFKENISIEGYTIKDSYKINDSSIILIGLPKQHNEKDEGLRIFHLIKKENKYNIQYISAGVNESYIYHPTFFKLKNQIVIICEMGAEYSWGLDAFLLENDSLKKLGNMNIATKINNEEHQESAISFLEINRKDTIIVFSFKNSHIINEIEIFCPFLYHKPGQENEESIPTNSISFVWANSWKMLKN